MENDGWQLNNNSEQFLDFNGATMENYGLQLNINDEQVFNFMPGTMENNGQQLMNDNNEQVSDIMGDDTDLNYPEFDMDVLLGTDDHHVGSNQRGDDRDRHSASGPPPPKRNKRFSVRQVQELEAMFKACTHPGFEVRQEIGERIGLDQRQVKFWFQNKRSQQKLKACGDENKEMLEENTKLRAENVELKQQLVNPTCFGCRNPIGAKQKESEKWLLLSENARLKDELLRSKANLNSIRGSQQHPSAMSSQRPASASAPPSNQQVTLVAHADRALKEFVMLATMGQPMWLPTVDGEVLSDKEYDLHTFPGMRGLCPRGYIVEATRETDMIQGTAIDVVNVLTDVAQWSGMFSNIVAYVRSSNVISSRGSSSSRDGLIQLMDADFWVQSSRLPIRSVKFLRFSKMMENRTWAVVDVSVPGNHGFDQESSGASYMGYRLLPSGCLLEDMSGGFCKVTWVVHSEYQEATVPAHFREFFLSGQAFGARRWLKSLQRQCEFVAVLLHSSNIVPSSSSAGATISALGKRSVLELAQRMTSSFYTAVSGPITVLATNIVDKLCVSSGTTATRKLEAAVRMVTWNCADVMPGEPSIAVMSATTTVWLPGTPPQRVFEYLCILQRRGEWDFFLNGRGVQEMVEYIPTSSRLHGNGVSILRPTTAIADGSHETNSNMLILQQTSTDMSGSMVVYSLIQENLMRRIMGGANNAIFLVPSGFAILPDGHGKSHCTAASSSTSSPPIGHNNGAGSLLTVAFQEMLSCGNHLAAGTFDNAGQKLCHAIRKIKNAVGANNVIPI